MKNKISLSQNFRSWLWKRKRESASKTEAYDIFCMDGISDDVVWEAMQIMTGVYGLLRVIKDRPIKITEPTYNVVIYTEDRFEPSALFTVKS